jgi:2-methylaconitate cis-trans-isomerase PrpF
MTSAIGPFAVEFGMVENPKDGTVTVRIHNTNTGKLIDASFPLVDGELPSDGEFAIDGVEGKAARIELAFLNPAGSKTGKLLPTGNAVDVIDGVKASLVDCGNPCCFVSAADLGVEGFILPDEIEAHPTLLAKLDRIRRQASVLMGLSKDTASATGSVPKIALVSTPVTHKILSGETVDGDVVDIVVRAISVGQPHRAVPITVAMAIAAASKVVGSTVNTTIGDKLTVDPKGLTLGHSSGKIVVGANFDDSGSLTYATVYRTARRLMEGYVFVK